MWLLVRYSMEGGEVCCKEIGNTESAGCKRGRHRPSKQLSGFPASAGKRRASPITVDHGDAPKDGTAAGMAANRWHYMLERGIPGHDSYEGEPASTRLSKARNGAELWEQQANLGQRQQRSAAAPGGAPGGASAGPRCQGTNAAATRIRGTLKGGGNNPQSIAQRLPLLGASSAVPIPPLAARAPQSCAKPSSPPAKPMLPPPSGATMPACATPWRCRPWRSG